MDPDALSARLGYQFRNRTLLRQALTHRSHSSPHNERLEFLGDSVLNCVVARHLFDAFPDAPEGELSRVRAHLVNQQTLAQLARDLGLGGAVLLGEGEVRSAGRMRPSILANALEALFGAIFLDGGFAAAQAAIGRIYAPLLEEIDPRALGKDPKTQLQEYLQGRHFALPRYSVLTTRGEAHAQRFEVQCAIPELDLRTTGEGASRRSAEQEAARLAYELATRGK
jgi:ribonuclease III